MEKKDIVNSKDKAPHTSSEVAHGISKVQVTVTHGQGYVWDPQDVWQLWRHHRVVGTLVGSLPRHPHQSNTLGLPLKLLPEEVTLLLEKGLGETVRYKEMEERPSQALKDTFNNQRENCYKEQVEEAARQRIDQVKRMAGKILEGKRKKFLMKQKSKEKANGNGQETKGSETETFNLTVEEIIKEEEERLQPLPPQHQLVEVFTIHPLLNYLTPEPCHWPYPNTQHERVKAKAFSDLWHQGLYLTSGIKFGGDFLVYSGNPHLYHAHAIVRCVAGNQPQLEGCDLVSATRVAAATKKTFVLATLGHNGGVIYRSYHWFEEQEQQESMASEDEEL